MEREYGIPRYNQEHFQSFAEREGLVIDVRPTNADAVRWLGEGALPKPADIKAKTINSYDLLLGPDLPADAKGLAAVFEPRMPSRDEATINGRPLTDEQWSALEQRFEHRAFEWARFGGRIGEGDQEGRFQVTEDGLIQGRDAEGEWRPITGDHDIFDIHHTDGSRLSPDELQQVINTLIDRGMGVQHGAHMYWNPTDPDERTRIYEPILRSHQQGGEPLIRFAPGRELARVWPDTPVTPSGGGSPPAGTTGSPGSGDTSLASSGEPPGGLPPPAQPSGPPAQSSGPPDQAEPRLAGGEPGPRPDAGDAPSDHHQPQPPPGLPERLHGVWGDSEATPAGRSFFTPGEQGMRDLAQRVPADPHHFIIDGHGDPAGMRIGDHRLTVDDVAELIRNDPNWNGRQVLLISCDTGQADFAQQLAQRLGVPVQAPTTQAWTDNQGRIFATTPTTTPTGQTQPTWPPNGTWNTHHPNGDITPTGPDGRPAVQDAAAGAAPDDARARGGTDGPGDEQAPPPPDPAREQYADLEEAERTARQLAGEHGVHVDYTAHPIDPANALGLNRALAQVVADYPRVFPHVGSIRVISADDMRAVGADPRLELAHTIHSGDRPVGGDPITPGIYLNQELFADRTALDEAAAEDRASGWNIDGTAEGTLYHEFGHVLENQLSKSSTLRHELAAALREVGIIVDPDGFTPKIPPGWRPVQEGLSRYGAKNSREMIAEAFTEWKLSPHPRPIATAMGTVLDRHFRG